jgi:hypothetical protein
VGCAHAALRSRAWPRGHVGRLHQHALSAPSGVRSSAERTPLCV